MTEQGLDRPQFATVLQEVGGATVTHGVGGGARRQQHLIPVLLDGLRHGGAVEAFAAVAEKQGVFRHAAQRETSCVITVSGVSTCIIITLCNIHNS